MQSVSRALRKGFQEEHHRVRGSEVVIDTTIGVECDLCDDLQRTVVGLYPFVDVVVEGKLCGIAQLLVPACIDSNRRPTNFPEGGRFRI